MRSGSREEGGFSCIGPAHWIFVLTTKTQRECVRWVRLRLFETRCRSGGKEENEDLRRFVACRGGRVSLRC